jgi:hypothetical protein
MHCNNLSFIFWQRKLAARYPLQVPLPFRQCISLLPLVFVAGVAHCLKAADPVKKQLCPDASAYTKTRNHGFAGRINIPKSRGVADGT